jgi:hypothetical protein
MKSELLARLQSRINKKLKKINPGYSVRHLTRASDGRYLFDLKVAIDPRHYSEIHEVFKSVLGDLPVDKPVQAKFYLPRSIYAQIKKRAATAGLSQSAFVAQCLSRHLSA